MGCCLMWCCLPAYHRRAGILKIGNPNIKKREKFIGHHLSSCASPRGRPALRQTLAAQHGSAGLPPGRPPPRLWCGCHFHPFVFLPCMWQNSYAVGQCQGRAYGSCSSAIWRQHSRTWCAAASGSALRRATESLPRHQSESAELRHTCTWCGTCSRHSTCRYWGHSVCTWGLSCD